jgi:tetratricopeptide (TPR) repeat protein
MLRCLTILMLASPFLRSQDLQPTCDASASTSLKQQGRDAVNEKRYEVAVQRLESAYAACSQDRAILLEISRTQMLKRDFEQAIASAQKYLKQDPGSIPGMLSLADAYFMGQRLTEAREAAMQVLRAEPGNSAALKIKGNSEYLSGDVSAATGTFIDLLDRHPADEEAAYMLGRIYYQEGMIDQSIGQFKRVLRINPRSHKAYDNLGLCYEAKGDNDTAIRYFLTAIKLVEKDHLDYDWAFANLADLLLKAGDAEKAYGAASQAVERNPNSARDFYIGGKALDQLGKVDLSLNWLQRSAALDPNYPEPEYLLTQIYRRLGMQDKAEEARKRFLEAKAKSPSSRK